MNQPKNVVFHIAAISSTNVVYLGGLKLNRAARPSAGLPQVEIR